MDKFVLNIQENDGDVYIDVIDELKDDDKRVKRDVEYSAFNYVLHFSDGNIEIKEHRFVIDESNIVELFKKHSILAEKSKMILFHILKSKNEKFIGIAMRLKDKYPESFI